MQARLFSIIFPLIWALAIADEFVPRVTESYVKSFHEPHIFYPGSLFRFGDSQTLMFYLKSDWQISFDNGQNWRSIDVSMGAYPTVQADKFHHERAFMKTNSGKTYITEDQGRSWRQLFLPEELEDEGLCSLRTNPFDKDFILANCQMVREKCRFDSYSEGRPESPYFFEHISYASNDAGRSFRRIVAPVDELKDFSDVGIYGTTCEFAASSKESIFASDGIYCVHELITLTGTQKFSNRHAFNQTGEDTIKETESSEQVSYMASTLFYTSDLGKSTKTFDELKDVLVEAMQILSSHIVVLTPDDNGIDDTSDKLWISKGGPFMPAHLPKGVTFSYETEDLLELDNKRILAYADVEAHEGYGKSDCLLVSDSSGLNFSFVDSIMESKADWMRLDKLGNLKGTLWGSFTFQEEVNRSDLADQDRTNKDARPFIECRYHKIKKASFDNGKTWIKPRVVDPSGKYRHLFECNIDDVEHCSFHDSRPYSNGGTEETAGILIKTGSVGQSILPFGKGDVMTFISRDGGASWEVAFEYPVHTTFLDFGNIIIAIPEKGDPLFTKFFFSLDQGRNWKEYHLNEGIPAYDVMIDGQGLDAFIRFAIQQEESTKYVFYALNFSEVYGGKSCTDDDWETWYLSNGTCIDGVRYSFERRKPEAQCLMSRTFENLTLHEEVCDHESIRSFFFGSLRNF